MNGIVIVGNRTLRFGYQACQEFEQCIFKNASTNHAKIFTDLIYAGIFGDALRNGKPTDGLYQEAYDLLDEVSEQDNFAELQLKIWDTYYNSKWGADFQKRLKEFTESNKKKGLEDLENQ